jgi:hypothetical protein
MTLWPLREYAGTIDAIARRIEGALARRAPGVNEVAGSELEPPREATRNYVPIRVPT